MAITSAFQADDAGSIPAARSNSFLCADIAQSVERTLGKGEVACSNHAGSTITNGNTLIKPGYVKVTHCQRTQVFLSMFHSD